MSVLRGMNNAAVQAQQLRNAFWRSIDNVHTRDGAITAGRAVRKLYLANPGDAHVAQVWAQVEHTATQYYVVDRVRAV